MVEHLEGKVALVQHDSYYRNMPEPSFEERARFNYDHPASLETELLVEHLVALRSGELIDKPVYDFANHLRSEVTLPVAPAPVILGEVILVEGILVLAEPPASVGARPQDLRRHRCPCQARSPAGA